jgi:hypothetical protein
MAGPERLELEAFSRRERSGEPAAEILSVAKDLACNPQWRARRGSNLRRLAGVSAARACCRNPERSEGSRLQSAMAGPERLELPTLGSEDRCSIQLSYGPVP